MSSPFELDPSDEFRWLERLLVYFPSANVALSPSDADVAAPCNEVFAAVVNSATGRADKPHAHHKVVANLGIYVVLLPSANRHPSSRH